MADEAVHFGVDVATGTVEIKIQPRFAIEPTVGRISILEFLDFAARTTLELNRLQRDAMVAAMAKRRA